MNYIDGKNYGGSLAQIKNKTGLYSPLIFQLYLLFFKSIAFARILFIRPKLG